VARQVSIVAFKKGQLRVLAHSWDRNLGGRDFDDALFDHFAAEFQAKHKLDVRKNARASFRLRVACEKVRRHRAPLATAHGARAAKRRVERAAGRQACLPRAADISLLLNTEHALGTALWPAALPFSLLLCPLACGALFAAIKAREFDILFDK